MLAHLPESGDPIIFKFMKLPFSLSFAMVLSLVISGGLQAADKLDSAFKTLEITQKQLGESGKFLLRMESDHAKLRPRQWWIRFYDEKPLLKVRAIHIIGPEIMKNTEPGNPFDRGDVEHIIRPEQLKYDSEKCIAFIEKAARENSIPLHSLNIRLEKPYPGESNPIWFFEWFDEKDKSLGKINISATTGKITEIVGLKLKDKKFESVSKKTTSQKGADFGGEVEGTFLGIGADLEEFFTGNRTVDKPDEPAKTEKPPKSK
jgi:hypothetical protein